MHSPFHRPWAEAPFPIKHELEKLVNGGMHAMTLYDSYSVITIVIYRVSQKKVDSNKYLLIFCRTCDIFESLHVRSRHHGTQENQDSDHL